MNGQEKKLINKVRDDILYELGQQRQWIENHEQRSLDIHKKIDKIVDKIYNFPCETHIATISWMKMSIVALWSVLIIGGLLRVASAYIWGA